jgi:outer membrane protein TolC
MNKLLALFSICLFAVGTLNGQDTAQSNEQYLGKLTLEQCIEIAQEQSPVAEAARFALAANRWNYESYQADLLPSLSVSGDAPNFNKSVSSNRLDDGSIIFQSRRQSEASMELSVNQRIMHTGGTLSLSSGLNRLGIFGSEQNYQWQSTPMVLGYSQPILGFNDLKWRREIEPLQYEIAQKEYVENMEGVAVDVTETFFEVLLAQINLENAEFNVARNDSIYNISQGRYEVGSIAENDLLQSELALRNAEATLSRARIEYDRALNNFKIILGFPTSVEIELAPPEDLPELDVTVPQAKQLAIQNNAEALNYQLSELQADRDYSQAKNEANLSATLNAQYGLDRVSNEFANLYNRPENRQFITVGFEVPIFNWGKQRAQINAARNQQREVANSIEYQRRQFIQQVEYTVSQFLQLKDQVELAEQSDKIAQRRYQVAENRYQIGKIDITDLFDAQTDRTSAREGYIQALSNFWTGWYDLRQLTLYDFQQDKPITFGDY